ncbi:MAG TPA: hypothetical protein P5531_11075 [Bacteroidales bacterium]|nr:hypothetical protein [Bacteroidales bacterium]HSA44105.1 hypothetical protein [Bacteroidales bacterium]
MKKYLVIISLCLTMSFQAGASHYMGGEVYWECLPNGQYLFHLRVYQECAGILYSTVSETLNTSVPGLPSIILYFVDSIDISPVCYPGPPPAFPHLSCETTYTSNSGGIREWIYQSNPVTLPAGPPPATGWVFAFPGCCRNPCANIVGTTSMNWYLQAIMYPYNNQPANICFDNPPVFAEKPVVVACTGYPSAYNHNGYDPDGDSIAYSWAQPLTGLNVPIPGSAYNNGYSWISPLPGAVQNPMNDTAVMDPVTGQITYTSFTQGAFVTKTACRTYRMGTLIAEVFREIQMVLLPCGNNLPPDVTVPFPMNPADQWVDTVYPGTLVTFPLVASDTALLNDNLTLQSVTMTAGGPLFGDGFTSVSTGCLEPPCATLNPPPVLSGISGVSTVFTWQPTCDHLSFGYGNQDDYVDYQFIFNFSDDYCPVPGLTTRVVHIVVKDPYLPAPVLDSFDIAPVTGHVSLFWNPLQDSLQSFHSYHIYYKDQNSGQYAVLDSLTDISQSSFTHTAINGNTQYFWYQLRCKSGCSNRLKFSAPSNVMSNYPTGTGNSNELTGTVAFVNNENRKLIIIPGGIKEPLTGIRLYHALGGLVVQSPVRVQPGESPVEISLAGLSPGLYIYCLDCEGSSIRGKFILR